MNRLLPTAALLFSLCALVVTFLLWREVRELRVEVAQHPIHARLSDEQFAVVKEFVDYIHQTFAEGRLPRGEVLLAEQLLNKARYMHGDISQEEWHRLNLAAEQDRTHLLIARLQAGSGTIADVIISYDDLLESSR